MKVIMHRRNFITFITSSISTFFLNPRALFSKSRKPGLFFDESVQLAGRITVRSNSLRVNEPLQLIARWGYRFISLEDLAHALHLGIYTNEQKKKSVLYIEKDRVTFAADNTFIKFNSQMLQIPLECLWYDNAVWIPLKYAITILDKYTPYSWIYNATQKELRIEETDVNIIGVRISARENGTLIDVFATKRFKEKEVILDIRNRWLHIDIYGAKIDPASIAANQPAGIISRIQAFQMAETASLSFVIVCAKTVFRMSR